MAAADDLFVVLHFTSRLKSGKCCSTSSSSSSSSSRSSDKDEDEDESRKAEAFPSICVKSGSKTEIFRLTRSSGDTWHGTVELRMQLQDRQLTVDGEAVKVRLAECDANDEPLFWEFDDRQDSAERQEPNEQQNPQKQQKPAEQQHDSEQQNQAEQRHLSKQQDKLYRLYRQNPQQNPPSQRKSTEQQKWRELRLSTKFSSKRSIRPAFIIDVPFDVRVQRIIPIDPMSPVPRDDIVWSLKTALDVHVKEKTVNSLQSVQGIFASCLVPKLREDGDYDSSCQEAIDVLQHLDIWGEEAETGEEGQEAEKGEFAGDCASTKKSALFRYKLLMEECPQISMEENADFVQEKLKKQYCKKQADVFKSCPTELEDIQCTHSDQQEGFLQPKPKSSAEHRSQAELVMQLGKRLAQPQHEVADWRKLVEAAAAIVRGRIEEMQLTRRWELMHEDLYSEFAARRSEMKAWFVLLVAVWMRFRGDETSSMRFGNEICLVDETLISEGWMSRMSESFRCDICYNFF